MKLSSEIPQRTDVLAGLYPPRQDTRGVASPLSDIHTGAPAAMQPDRAILGEHNSAPAPHPFQAPASPANADTQTPQGLQEQLLSGLPAPDYSGSVLAGVADRISAATSINPAQARVLSVLTARLKEGVSPLQSDVYSDAVGYI